jgi:hypothetical protein
MAKVRIFPSSFIPVPSIAGMLNGERGAGVQPARQVPEDDGGRYPEYGEFAKGGSYPKENKWSSLRKIKILGGILAWILQVWEPSLDTRQFPTNLAFIEAPEEDNKWQHKTKSARHQNNSTQH